VVCMNRSRGTSLQPYLSCVGTLNAPPAPPPPPQGKEPPVTIGQEAGAAQNRSGRRGEEKSLAPTRTPTPRPSIP
jgi:hypothetical protein